MIGIFCFLMKFEAKTPWWSLKSRDTSLIITISCKSFWQDSNAEAEAYWKGEPVNLPSKPPAKTDSNELFLLNLFWWRGSDLKWKLICLDLTKWSLDTSSRKTVIVSHVRYFHIGEGIIYIGVCFIDLFIRHLLRAVQVK